MALTVTGAGKTQEIVSRVNEEGGALVPDVLSEYLFDEAALKQFNSLTESGKEPCKWQICPGHTNYHTKSCTHRQGDEYCSKDTHTNEHFKFKCCK